MLMKAYALWESRASTSTGSPTQPAPTMSGRPSPETQPKLSRVIHTTYVTRDDIAEHSVDALFLSLTSAMNLRIIFVDGGQLRSLVVPGTCWVQASQFPTSFYGSERSESKPTTGLMSTPARRSTGDLSNHIYEGASRQSRGSAKNSPDSS